MSVKKLDSDYLPKLRARYRKLLQVNNQRTQAKNENRSSSWLVSGDCFIVNDNGYLPSLKLGGSLDGDNDRVAYGHVGDITALPDDQFARYIWRVAPYSIDNETVYTFSNSSMTSGWLKLGGSHDGDGDYTAYGHDVEYPDPNDKRFYWTLTPIGDFQFYVYNYSLSGVLKLGGSKDNDGDYQAYGHIPPDDLPSDVGRFQWFINSAD